MLSKTQKILRKVNAVASKVAEHIISNEDYDHEPESENYKPQIDYGHILKFGYWHLAAFYGIYLCCTSAKWASIVFSIILYVAAEIGITAGAHRLWSHKSYKAKLPLEILLMIMNSIAFQKTATDWVRDHRIHHKYSDTDADPHNPSLGFFYSHIGWLLTRKHPEVKKKEKTIHVSDIYSNPVLKFQKKYAILLLGSICLMLPTVIPMYLWGETFSNAWHLNLLRYAMNLHATLLINSAAHRWGKRPYDKTIQPAENVTTSIVTLGEGYHNYHHVFPWDYRAAELGNNPFNFTTTFIDFFAWIGWAYDLKSVSADMIKARSERTGEDKSLQNFWSWEDTDFTDELKESLKVKRHSIANSFDNVVKYRDEAIIVELGQLPHHVFVFKRYGKEFRAFCAGSIITEKNVLSTASCYITHRKRYKLRIVSVNTQVAAGVFKTVTPYPPQNSDTQQWRTITKVHSQKFYRFPVYNLAILVLKQEFLFNQFVNKIPIATLNQDFDGVCESVALKATSSWASKKRLYKQELHLVAPKKCKNILLRSVALFYCLTNKEHAEAYSEIEGSGLICHRTGDPAEVNEEQGILVGVTSCINLELPSLYTRVALFNKWIKDGCSSLHTSKLIQWVCLLIVLSKLL